MKLNKKGVSFADTLVGMFLLMLILTMLFQFLSFLKNSKSNQDISTVVIQTLNNESERAYRTLSWETLEGAVYSTPKGDVESIFSNYHITEHDTEYLLLEVSVGDFTQNIPIERSVFWNE